jgi:hypothetical protein
MSFCVDVFTETSARLTWCFLSGRYARLFHNGGGMLTICIGEIKSNTAVAMPRLPLLVNN